MYVSKLISKLHEKARFEETAVVDMVNWYNFTTFDLIGDLAFGESFGCLELGLLHPWVRCVFEFIKMIFLYQAFARIHPLLAIFVNLVISPSQANDAKKHNEYSVALARKRIDTKTDRPDFSESLPNFELGIPWAESMLRKCHIFLSITMREV